MEKIAIIGLGISGSACLAAYQHLAQSHDFDLVVFDREPYLGRGIPFTESYEGALMNTRNAGLTYDQAYSGDFETWLKAKDPDRDWPEYSSRYLFGSYLRERVGTLLENLQAQLVKEYVAKVNFDQEAETWCLETESGQVYTGFDRIHLCCGDLGTNDFYRLEGTSRYLNQAYPLEADRYQMDEEGLRRVAVIGTSLSAIDVIKYLADICQPNQILAFSRGNQFPIVSGKEAEDLAWAYLSEENFQAAQEAEEGLTYQQVDQWIQADCQNLGLDWADCQEVSLSQGIEGIRRAMDWTSQGALLEALATRVTRLLFHYWQYLSLSDRQQFADKYDKVFSLAKGKMPLASAQRLLDLADEGCLSSCSGVEEMIYDKQTGLYYLLDQEGMIIEEVDYIVNATGINLDLRQALPQDSLLYDLRDQGWLNPDPAQGVSLDVNRYQLISPRFGRLDHVHPHGLLIAPSVYHNNSTTTIQRYAQDVINWHYCGQDYRQSGLWP